MNQPQVFSNTLFGDVRILEEDGKILFCASDVANALGYKRPNNAVSAHCRGALKRGIGVQTGKRADGTPVFQQVEMNFIPEGDVYRLITHSTLPTAERFEQWVFDEVLPTIRRTGSYQAKPMTPAEMFAAQAQVNLEYERRLSDLDRRADATETALRNTVRALSVPTFTLEDWQREMQATLNMAVRTYGLNHQTYRGELYRTLEERAHVDLSSRQTRLRNRLLRQGATTAQVKEVSKLSVIARDPKLREIFHAVFQQDLAQRFCSQPQENRRALQE